MNRRGQSSLPTRLKYLNKTDGTRAPARSAPTWLQLARGNKLALPLEFRREDVRFSDSLVELFVNEFTAPGQIVFDPFAGYGTTLLVAESMGRTGYGIEYGEKKAAYVQGLLPHAAHLLHGDSRRLHEYDLPSFDLCLTSPPYTQKSADHNPFVDYRERGFSYAAYLQAIENVFSQVARKMNPSAHVVIEIANLKQDGLVTTLAWDVARVVSQILQFEGERIICWDEYGYGYDHSYCLVFSNP